MTTPPFVVTEDFLRWEFETTARARFMWHRDALTHARAADLLYSHADRGRRLARSVFARDAVTGLPLNVGKPLSPADTDALGDAGLVHPALGQLALALENETKGLLIARNPSLVDGQDGLAGWLTTHKLTKLLDACGVALSTAESEVVLCLSEYGRWAGKYPVPRHALPNAHVVGAWDKRRLGPVEPIWATGRALFDRLVAIGGW